MAMSFSPANPVRTTYPQPKNKQNPLKTFSSLRDTFTGSSSSKCNSAFPEVVSWSSASNYVTLQASTRRFSGKLFAVKQVAGRRQVIVAASILCCFYGCQYMCLKSVSWFLNCVMSFCLVPFRTGNFRCATIEEIEAEKSVIEKNVKERMEKTLETVRSNFNSIRTGRANPAMLDRVEVEYYGTPVSLKSIAQISTPDASSILVQPYDKSSLKDIEKAIVSSDLGLTPNNDGEVIRLSLPQLTSERRKELSKVVAKQMEEGKVALRNVRRDAIKAYEKLQKEKKLSEDNVKDLSSDLQKVTDEYMKKIDSVYKQKEKELLTV